ncbi:hypothetical protein GO755_24750 [Spirosoma sp. HMF4905]|uniref:Uncharacterized protein n=1 Tax=Spirosoma arboris TaxID=2682092 RepID=A0A7K1SHN6_9BACT|nr:hypothetical protein [Spirosoma arboris]
MVPELEAYKEYALVSAVAAHRGISFEQVEQLPYGNFMASIGYLHHQARYQHEIQSLMKQRNGH